MLTEAGETFEQRETELEKLKDLVQEYEQKLEAQVCLTGEKPVFVLCCKQQRRMCSLISTFVVCCLHVFTLKISSKSASSRQSGQRTRFGSNCPVLFALLPFLSLFLLKHSDYALT